MYSSDEDNDSQDEKRNKKTIPKKVYRNKVKEAWYRDEKYRQFLQKSKKGLHHVLCTYCNTDISIAASGSGDIDKHMKTQLHKKKAIGANYQPSVSNMPEMLIRQKLDDDVKDAEIKLTLFLIEHNIAFNNADHLCALIKRVASNPKVAEKLTLGRTKATALCTNVIGQHSKTELIEILKHTKFSVLIDECTDVSGLKHLCLVVRYFDKSLKRITDQFLDLIEISDADAETLHTIITKCFTDYGIDINKNLIGFGSDGASVMCGHKNSVASRLMKDPGVYYMKCICHTFNLIASEACEELPRNTEELIRDIYNYIQTSPKRTATFHHVQQLHGIKPYKLLRNCATRWLSIQPAVNRVLLNWDALLSYFEEVGKTEKLLVVQSIVERMKNPQTKIYLEFLKTVLPYFKKFTLIFQREKPEIHQLYADVATVFKQFAEFCSEPVENLAEVLKAGNLLPRENIYIGLEAELLMDKFLQHHPDIKKDIWRRCFNFYCTALNGILKRFNFNDKWLEGLKLLNPKNIEITSSVVPLLQLHNKRKWLSSEDVQKIDTEWRDLRSYLRSMPDELKADAFDFWIHVSEIKVSIELFDCCYANFRIH